MPCTKLSSSYFPQLLDHLRQLWPDSLMIYSIVNSLHRGVPTGFNVYTDKWPDPEAIVANADPEKCKNTMWKSFVFTFERNPSALMSLLTGEDRVVLDTSRNLLFPGIPTDTFKVIKESFPDKTFRGYVYDTYWIKDNEKLIKRSIPSGFRKGLVTEEFAAEVAKNSPYSREGFTEAVFQGTLSGYPNIVLYEDNSEKPAGWYMQGCCFGTIGNLFVSPEFRGRGLGKYLASELAKEVLERDGVAFMHVAQDNKVSKQLHEDLGFENCGVIAYKVMVNVS